MTDLTRASAAELADLMARGETTSREITTALLERTEAVDGAVHSYLHVDRDGALATADAVDRRRAAERHSTRSRVSPSRSRTS